MRPFFSICIPVFNGARYLRECIESVINQTFQDFEIVIVDDGSSDGSVDLVKELRMRESRIRLFENSCNLGLVGNWNKCMNDARGSWIKFLFQDDFLEPDCLHELYNSREKSDFIFHGRRFLIHDEANDSLKRFYTSPDVVNSPWFAGKAHLSDKMMAQLIADKPGFNFIGEPSNVAFRKQLVDEIGSFDERLAHLCDYEFWCRITNNVGAYHIDRKLSCFRVHKDSASSFNLARRKHRYRYIDALVVYYEFSRGASYFKLRDCVRPFYFKKLYERQVATLRNVYHNYSVEERILFFEDISKYAPFAIQYFKGLRLFEYKLKARAKKVLKWMSV